MLVVRKIGPRAAILAASLALAALGGAALAAPPPRGDKAEEAARAQAQRDYDKAVRFSRAGRAQEALEQFERALPYKNETSDIFYNLVMVSEAAKRWDKVLLYAQGFLVLEPGSGDAAEIAQKLDVALKRLAKGEKVPVPVTFTVDPPEARVLVRGTPIVGGRRTTALLLPGGYVAEATLPDYTTAGAAFEVKAGVEAVPVELKLTPIVFEGTLAVVTEPSDGVQVWVDDKLVGVTPLAPLTLPTLRYLVRLERPGYDRWVRYVQVERDQTATVKATLEALQKK